MIIENDAQCHTTKEWIRRFSENVAYLDAHPPTDDLKPWMHKLLRDSHAGDVKTLQRQVTAYETGIHIPPFQPAPEYLEEVARVRKEFEDRFGQWEFEGDGQAIS